MVFVRCEALESNLLFRLGMEKFMVSGAHAISRIFWIPLSFQPSLLLFVGFSALVVHVCGRLIDRVSLTIDPTDRKAAIARTSVCVGSMVWALDVSGLFLYRTLFAQDARLLPAVLALGIMMLSARLTVPALSGAARPRRLIPASVGLALGILLAHMALMSSIGTWTGTVQWRPFGLSIGLAAAVASGIAIRHRLAQLRAVGDRFHSIPLPTKVVAGIAILPLHFFLVNAFPVTPASAGTGGGISVLLVLVLFSMAISIDHMFNLQMEVKRQQLLNRALAMVRCVHPQVAEIAERQLAMIVERREILLSPSSMEMHFQPICPIQSPEEGVRFEALLRVVDPELGPIHPELFFLACERVGMSVWADRIILERALECSRPWLDSGCRGISVNVGPDTLMDPGFAKWLSELVEAGGWPWGWLQLELTEHAMIASPAPLVEAMEQLRVLGISVVLDDFGAGFSSLTVLMELPIYGIKCDQAFVRGLGADEKRQTVLRYLFEMGEELGLSITVEGVETESDLAIVSGMGVHQVQGNLFSHPLASKHVEKWLASHQPASHRFVVPALES